MAAVEPLPIPDDEAPGDVERFGGGGATHERVASRRSPLAVLIALLLAAETVIAGLLAVAKVYGDVELAQGFADVPTRYRLEPALLSDAVFFAALLILARYWFRQGRPKPKKVRPLGSFESWCNVVGGILELAGVNGVLGNADVMFEQADSDGVQWEAFFLVLAEVFDDEPFRVTDVFDKLGTKDGFSAPDAKRVRGALPDFIAEAADRTGGFFQRRLGKCFAERVGRRFGDSQVFLERADEDRKAKVQRWRVVRP